MEDATQYASGDEFKYRDLYVLLRGLATEEFNGRVGLLERLLVDSGRWQVSLITPHSLNTWLSDVDDFAMISEKPRSFRQSHLYLFTLPTYRQCWGLIEVVFRSCF